MPDNASIREPRNGEKQQAEHQGWQRGLHSMSPMDDMSATLAWRTMVQGDPQRKADASKRKARASICTKKTPLPAERRQNCRGCGTSTVSP
jgi:ribosomal protein L40E